MKALDNELQRAHPIDRIKAILDPQSVAPQLSKDARNTLLKGIWIKEIIPDWNNTKGSNKIKKLLWHGIPSSIRGSTWKIIIGNKLNIDKSKENKILGL
jgi:hypothetical protein